MECTCRSLEDKKGMSSSKIKILSRIKNKSEDAPCIQALPNRRCWITSDDRKKIQLRDEGGTVQREITLGDFDTDIHIFHVADDEDVYFQSMETMDHSLYKFSHADDDVDEFDDIGIYDAWSIRCTKDGRVLTAQQSEDEEGKCVLYDSEGSELMIIQSDEDENPYFDYPICSVENGNADICIADLYKPGVFIFSEDGKMKSLYSGPDLSGEGCYKPWSLDVDGSNDIFILDQHHKRIDMIDQDGVYVCKLMGETDGLIYPKSISIGEDGVMWISQYKADTLVVEYNV